MPRYRIGAALGLLAGMTPYLLGTSRVGIAADWGAIVAGAIAVLLLLAGVFGWLRKRLAERRFPHLEVNIRSAEQHIDDDGGVWLWFLIRISGQHRLHSSSISLDYRAKLYKTFGNTDIRETLWVRPQGVAAPEEVPPDSLHLPVNISGKTSASGVHVVYLSPVWEALRDPTAPAKFLVEDHASRRAVAILAFPGTYTRKDWIELRPDERGYWTVFDKDGVTSTEAFRVS